MAKVLVTGGLGLLGSALVPYLREHGHEVFILGRSGNVEVCVDLEHLDLTFAALDKIKPDVIVNLAALTNVDRCEQFPQQAYLANVRIVENLAVWIRRGGDGCQLIQISTDQVYDGTGPHSEQNISLTNFYSFSKYAGELAAATVPCTILRSNFFGESLCPSRLSLSDWLVKSLKEKAEITVFNDVHFSPLSLQSLVRIIGLVVRQKHSGTFNLGSTGGMSKAEFAYTLADTLGFSSECLRSGTSELLNLKAYRPKDMRMDSALFEDTFKLKLPTLEEEILSMKGVYSQ